MKRKIISRKAKKAEREAGLGKVIADMFVKAFLICAAAGIIGLSYTGLRAALGVDKKPEAKQAVAAEETALPAPVVVPVKEHAVPAKFKYLFKEVKTKEEIPKIHIEEAKVLFESGKALFIDARSRGEYTESHIPGSIYIGAGDPPEKIKENADALKDKVLVAYCHGAGCHLSDKVAYKLYDEGYRKIAIHFGGWPEWTQAAMPVEKYQAPEKYKHLFDEAAGVKDIVNISLEEAKYLHDNWLANFVDVDYTDKYNEIRIDRAVSIPIDKIDEMLPGYKAFLDQKPFIVYCHGMGGKSRKAVEKMFNAGHKKILRFVQAIQQWEKAGYPLQKMPDNRR